MYNSIIYRSYYIYSYYIYIFYNIYRSYKIRVSRQAIKQYRSSSLLSKISISPLREQSDFIYITLYITMDILSLFNISR